MSEETQKKLTPKQKLFCEYFLGDAKFNGTKAAIMAGYSEKTAYSIASENLKKPEIIAYMRELQSAHGINEFQTMQELRDVAYSEWRHHVNIIYDYEGNEKECILMLKDKVKALEILAKIQKLTDDKANVSVEVNLPKVYAGFDPDEV